MLIDRLIEKIRELHSPIVVGLDPRLEQIPAAFKEPYYQTDGKTPATAAKIILTWGKEIIDQVCDLVPAVKPQIAMYEQFGAPGIDCYIQTVGYAKSKGLVVIGDIKRGDIAEIAGAYSDGHIGMVKIGGSSHPVFNEDFITVNPYLGYDAVEPFLANCEKYGKGLFILVKTSNKSSGDIQDLATKDGAVYEIIAGLIKKWGAHIKGESGYSSIGAVVGATHPEQAKKIRQILPEAFFLVPGYGAQGGTAEDLAACFDNKGLGAVVNSSRGIIFAYMDDKYKRDFPEDEFEMASRQACIDMREDLKRITGLK